MRDGPEDTQVSVQSNSYEVGPDTTGEAITSLAMEPYDGVVGTEPTTEKTGIGWRGLGDFREALAEAVLDYGFDYSVGGGISIKAVDVERVRAEILQAPRGGQRAGCHKRGATGRQAGGFYPPL